MKERTKLSIILETKNLTKYFGGLQALRSIDFQVKKGEIRALIGPNGAGKTTFLNVLTGLYPPSGGDVQLKGVSILGLKPHSITQRGIARTFQAIRLFGEMSVLENVMIAHHCRTKEGILSTLLRTEASKKEEKMIQERALETLKAVGLDEKKGQVAKSLPYGEQRLLEMARALSTEPDLILLDEPSAGMNRKEATWLMERIENIRTQGITIILVEHNMRLVMNISHRVTVLDFGEKIAEGTPEEIKNNSKVIEAYLGKKGDHART